MLSILLCPSQSETTNLPSAPAATVVVSEAIGEESFKLKCRVIQRVDGSPSLIMPHTLEIADVYLRRI